MIKKLCFTFYLWIILFIVLAGSNNLYAVNTDSIVINYFYTNVCESCREADETIDYYKDLLQNEPGKVRISIVSYNIAKSEGLIAYREFLDYYHIDNKEITVPVLFSGDKYFTGPVEIEKALRSISLNGVNNPDYYVFSKADDSKVKRDFSGLTLSGVAITGFVNGLNTCALSMFLFLTSLLLAKPDIKVGMAGSAFIAGKFVTYFLIGSVFYSLISNIDMQVYSIVLKAFLSIFAVTMAFLNFGDYIKSRKENYGKIKNQLPVSVRKFNHKIISKINDTGSGLILIISSLILGIIISIGEFLCTGQLYIATIGYILQTSEYGFVPYFLLGIYSLCFIIPASIIFFIIIKTRKTILMSEYIRKKIPAIKFATGILLIFSALITIFLF